MNKKILLTSTLAFIVILMTVTFAYNSSELDYKARQDLDKLAFQLDSLSDYTIHLSGHTDNTGTDRHNEQLSKQRVNAVKNYLISKNADSTKIICVFYGEQKPAVPNSSEENRALNRRVELRIEGKKVIPDAYREKNAEQVKSQPIVLPEKKEETITPVKQEIKKKKNTETLSLDWLENRFPLEYGREMRNHSTPAEREFGKQESCINTNNFISTLHSTNKSSCSDNPKR